MLKIENITNYPLQKRTMVLPDATTFEMTMYFIPMQIGWFITNLTYGDFVLNGLRISNQPNMLRQWKNILPFGLGCYSKADKEPGLIEDFASGTSELFILTQDEVLEYEAYLNG